MKHMKKLAAVLITVSMVIGLFGILPAFATFYVYTVDDLINVRDQINQFPALGNDDIVLMSDLDFTAWAAEHSGQIPGIPQDPNVIMANSGWVYNWQPIESYSGHFYGNNYRIDGLYIDPTEGVTSGRWTSGYRRPDCSRVGLFSALTVNAIVEDLTIGVDKIEGSCYVGALVGWDEADLIQKVTVTTANGQDGFTGKTGLIIGVAAVGGVAGLAINGNIADIMDCKTVAPLTVRAVAFDSADPVYHHSERMNLNETYRAEEVCQDIEAIYYAYEPVFPLIFDAYLAQAPGYGYKSAEGCYAGGIVGMTKDNGVEIRNCTNSAYVRANCLGAGGIVGGTLNGGFILNCENTNEAYIAGGSLYEWRFMDPIYYDSSLYVQDIGYVRYPSAMPLDEDHLTYDPYRCYCNGSIGGIVGQAAGRTLIENCANSAPIESEGDAGGIAGTVLGVYTAEGVYNCNYTRIANCVNEGRVHTDGANGGIAGQVCDVYTLNRGNYTNPCGYCTGTALGNAYGRMDVYTIDGYCDNVIENCYNLGEVRPCAYGSLPNTGYTNNGGIVGLNSGLVRNCYSINTDYLPAGIAAWNGGWIEHCFGEQADAVNPSPTPPNTGIVTNYMRFDPTDAPFLLLNPGVISGSMQTVDEMNDWVQYYGGYLFDVVYRSYLQPYNTWGVRRSPCLVFDAPYANAYGDGDGSYDYSQAAQPVVNPGQTVAHSLSLNGDLMVNYYVSVPDATPDCVAEFTFGEESLTVPINLDNFSERDGVRLYKFPCPVNASQTSTEIKCVVNNPVWNEDQGAYEFRTSESLTYSVNEYIETTANNEYYNSQPEFMNLMCAVSDYGYYSNELLGTDPAFTTSVLFDGGPVEAIDPLKLDELEAEPVIMDNNGFVDYIGSSLVLKTTTAIRHYYKLKPDAGKYGVTLSDYHFMLDDVELEPKQNGNNFYVEIPNIKAPELGWTQVVTVMGPYLPDPADPLTVVEGVSAEWFYSGLSYAWKTFQLTSPTDAQINFAKALTYYYICAEAYFNRDGA